MLPLNCDHRQVIEMIKLTKIAGALMLLVGSVGAAHATSQNAIIAGEVDLQIFKDAATPSFVESAIYNSRLGVTVVKVDADYTVGAHEWLSSLGLNYEWDKQYRREIASSVDAYRGIVQSQTNNFTDPRLAEQVELSSQLNNMLEGMSYQRTRSSNVSVLLMDVGTLPHEDVVFSGGYSFVSSPVVPERLPSDYADYTGQSVNQCVSGHGLSMAGIIGATQNNQYGITGIANAPLYMGRIMQTNCDNPAAPYDYGSLLDLADGLVAASDGVEAAIPVPDVVYVGLSVEGACPSYLQNGINRLTDKGIIVVAPSGNNGGQVSGYSPANCTGVVVAGAHTELGDSSPYSNTGGQVDVTALGARLTTLKNGGYGVVDSTDAAAAAVTGYAALIKQQFPLITQEKAEYILKKSTNHYPESSGCTTQCGSGMVNVLNGIKMAEKLIDPRIDVSHSFVRPGEAACEVSNEFSALAQVMDTCNALRADVKVSYLTGENPVEYKIKAFYRPLGVADWLPLNKELSPKVANDTLALPDMKMGDNTYAIAACDGDDCPFIQIIAKSNILYPAGCN